jgi:hypothetical protein
MELRELNADASGPLLGLGLSDVIVGSRSRHLGIARSGSQRNTVNIELLT